MVDPKKTDLWPYVLWWSSTCTGFGTVIAGTGTGTRYPGRTHKYRDWVLVFCI